MAARRTVPAPAPAPAPIHHRVGGAQPAEKQQKPAATAAVEGNNRRALGDISKIVNVRPADGKQGPPVTRPITRSFGAQLLRNAHVVGGQAPPTKNPGKHPTQQDKENPKEEKPEEHPPPVAVAKPPPAASDAKPPPQVICLSSSSRSRPRKKPYSLTSALATRSRAACGIGSDGRPKSPPHDIDRADADDHLAGVEYVEDIYTFYRAVESQERPNCRYMETQGEINPKMRTILADWLVEVHYKFELMPETLFLTVHIVDRYLSLEQVPRRELQLLGVSAMLVACKYEEIWAPEVNDFICISDRAYSRAQILAMEKKILNKMEWSLTVPTTYVFLVRFIKAASSTPPSSSSTPPTVENKEMGNMAFFLAELGLLQYSMLVYSPSKFAAAAVYAARRTLERSPAWTETLRHHTGYKEEELVECAGRLVGFHSRAGDSKFKAVQKKYTSQQRGMVALRPPASMPLPSGELSGEEKSG